MAAPLSLKDYLKRYESTGEDEEKKKKKKKKKEKVKPSSMGGILVVDEDPVWQKPVQIEQEESESADEEKPQIDEDIEVKRMKRLESIRARKPYHAISEDGSGWVSISNSSKHTKVTEPRSRFDTPSPRTREASHSTDISPPQRRQRRADTPPEAETALPLNQEMDISPTRRTRESSFPSPDLSPPKRGGKHLSNDLSPPRKISTRTHNPSDLSPPRRSRRFLSPDASPPRQTRHIFSDDTGPPASPVGDLSPPRRGSKDLSNDLSPPRRTRPQSPEAIRGRNSSPTDLSPPRKSRKVLVEKEPRRGGLLSAKDLREENDRTRKEALSRFASLDPSLSGKSAKPVYRDAKGKAISKEELLKPKEEEKPKEKKLEWGKGLAQKRQAEANTRELELEKDKPFARMKDDPDLDQMLKERVRWGDPMAHLVKQKNSETILEDLGENEAMKESGFIIPQTIPAHSWLKRGVDCPPNRYGIKPGRHWDGVDRSNGFEKDMYKRQNEKRATEREAYLWSVSDM
ncbi:BUD13 homolog isoform X1 [Zingiber officinale]|uniref:BUD13 homolog n=1 Tax=Zingiber officinale TaxID=94328 RepID=A0A8J5HB70_ZINOF|nr:BUD13 homolog isoform X1 [Zingiber officinale]KAG6515094.1 hypothetical protein ZIOFF_025479 [Zingiber officinale]